MPTPIAPRREYLVTVTQTTTVSARSPQQACWMGEEKIDFHGPDTTNIEAEEIGPASEDYGDFVD